MEDLEAKEAFEKTRNGHGWSTPSWEDLAEETRQMYRDWVSNKQPTLKDAYAVNVRCTVNRKGDMEINPEARTFVGRPCVIIRRHKSGLVEVGLEDDINFRIAVPQRNIDLL